MDINFQLTWSNTKECISRLYNESILALLESYKLPSKVNKIDFFIHIEEIWNVAWLIKSAP